MNQQASPELAALLATPPSVGRLAGFREGAAAPWRGLKFLNRHKALWRYAMLPVAANLLITGLVLLLLVLIAAWFLSVAHPWFQQEDADRPTWVWWTAEIVFGVALLIVCVGAAMLLWKLLTGILCGYFYGLLAKEVEITLGVAPEELRDLSFKYQVFDTVYGLAALIATHGVFFVVGLLPLIGAPLAVAGNFSVTWFILGRDYMDFPLALRGLRRRDKQRYCRNHLPHTLGLGAVVFVMEFLPIIGAVFLTTTVVGAVLLYRRLVALDEQSRS